MGTTEICLLIIALYTLILLIIAAQYSTRTIETLGELVHQLINKIDAHNETVLKDTRTLVSAITGQSGLDNSEESSETADNNNPDEKSDLQYLFEDFRPTMYSSKSIRYDTGKSNNDTGTDVSKTTVINPYDEHKTTKAS